jgi:hypothetical protein
VIFQINATPNNFIGDETRNQLQFKRKLRIQSVKMTQLILRLRESSSTYPVDRFSAIQFTSFRLHVSYSPHPVDDVDPFPAIKLIQVFDYMYPIHRIL